MRQFSSKIEIFVFFFEKNACKLVRNNDFQSFFKKISKIPKNHRFMLVGKNGLASLKTDCQFSVFKMAART
jgi:hypothetical protein